MDVFIGWGMLMMGPILAFLAEPLQKMNASGSKFLYGENRSAKASKVHVWIFRIAGTAFFILGFLIVVGVVQLASQR
ncbi:hypothetical protein [Streptomyces zingiberis]|uniref:Uncharacterized protein n=1 Tax=Streptomyces zingiberis TaxID=2053010 RepID=A0ABX1BU67_9ACTN|nr:hypothetical protein [Streptomyces zingiberis]NJQ01260.1 hypothetical protein [Streptomyces zingiberis]